MNRPPLWRTRRDAGRHQAWRCRHHAEASTERKAEKLAELESLADALSAFWQLHRELDQWERFHLGRGIAAVLSGLLRYGVGAVEAVLALTPVVERNPRAKLPTDPFYNRLDLAFFERVLNAVWGEPARRLPHLAPIEMP
jgi:hypothetical protein